jgi:hypothetical protein
MYHPWILEKGTVMSWGKQSRRSLSRPLDIVQSWPRTCLSLSQVPFHPIPIPPGKLHDFLLSLPYSNISRASVSPESCRLNALAGAPSPNKPSFGCGCLTSHPPPPVPGRAWLRQAFSSLPLTIIITPIPPNDIQEVPKTAFFNIHHPFPQLCPTPSCRFTQTWGIQMPNSSYLQLS